ncbi:hypothetical protein YDYSG_54050 [Paenibacillus tyrfis]|uniref:S-layer homology domain-containing protein n=1 Tax=Paenibacillus TaxID=44249 RepID=UPI00248FE343|nr:S-layer homology domain-containing protein [Paenibacillus tyrfis]GLI09373.1 hypothetical protein YDYSG_54050 [Paenibacillus tyrfis]GMX60424.1 hypothetical protein Elgi_05860 [Paenibacillus elgii]
MNKMYSSWYRKLAVLLSLSVLLSLWPRPASAEVNVFPDVDAKQYAWAVESIRLMANKQVLTGYPDGNFRPNKTISKAEWTAMVYRLFDKYRPNALATGMQKITYFTDVPELHWAHKPISEIYDGSFKIGGYGLSRDGNLAFRPDMQLTRLQLAQLLYAYFDNRLMEKRFSDNDVCSVVSELKDVPVKMFKTEAEYQVAQADGRYVEDGLMDVESNDVFVTLILGKNTGDCRLGGDELSNVQAKALASLKASGIMTPNDQGYFRPKDYVTRAEAVTILDRVYTYLKKNGWLWDYTTVDLALPFNPAGTGTDSGSIGGSNGSSGSSSFNNNPNSNTITPPNGGYSQDGSINWSDKSIVRVTDYFDDKGVIVKNLQQKGEIEAAVQPKGARYLTITLKSDEKVDMYVIVDGRVGFVKQEEFPLTLQVSGVTTVGLRSQLRNPDKNKRTDDLTTLSVQLSDVEPSKKKEKTKSTTTKP